MLSNMKRRSSLGFLVVMAVLVVVGGIGLALQRQETTLLRAELDLARSETRELGRLLEQNRQLREQQISDAELEMLRADHAALPGLRAEIEAFKKRSQTE